VNNLAAKARKKNKWKEIFHTTWTYFKENWGHLPEDAFKKLTRKGIYPYSYMDSFERFKETLLPPK
jgi:hypothetical protein